VRFTGTAITLYGVMEPWSTIASVSIDGTPPTDVDFYSPQVTESVAVFTAPALSPGAHTLVLTATARRNPASSGGDAITFDRAVVGGGATAAPSATPSPSPVPSPSPAVLPSPLPSASPAPSPTTSAVGTPTSGPAPSGFWLSGGSRDTNRLSAAIEWGAFRGRPVTFAVAYPTRTAGWDEFVRSHAVSGQVAAHSDKSMTLLIQTAPFAQGGNYSALVGGSYDAQWRQIGTLLKARQDQGHPPAIVSIAWEMNGEYMYWGGGAARSRGGYSSPAQYVAGYRRIVSQLRVTYPNVQTAWVINAHSTPAATGTTDAFAFYPGDEFVTYMGTDDYDHYPPARTKAAFDARANANAGMYWLANHARQHGKQIVVPEWGVAPGSGANGGGDNPEYVQWMWDTFRAWFAEGLLRGEFYFADPIGGGNVDSDLLGGNPAAAARYRSLW
jgi:Glycosyl hydrolase family 26